MSIQPSDYLALSIEERWRLIDEIQASIVAEEPIPPLTPEQAEELDRRIADADANPGDEMTLEEFRARLRQQT
jgi:putative addiction module component (TIGR02574 family)